MLCFFSVTFTYFLLQLSMLYTFWHQNFPHHIFSPVCVPSGLQGWKFGPIPIVPYLYFCFLFLWSDSSWATFRRESDYSHIWVSPNDLVVLLLFFFCCFFFLFFCFSSSSFSSSSYPTCSQNTPSLPLNRSDTHTPFSSPSTWPRLLLIRVVKLAA